MAGRQGNAGNNQTSTYTGGNNTFSGSKRHFSNVSEESEVLNQWQMDNLPRHVKTGGNERSRGQGSNCGCTLCYRMGHTFEFCRSMNGYQPGGPPMERFGLPKPKPPPKRLNQQGPVLRLTQ
jgi:hypothetical protein